MLLSIHDSCQHISPGSWIKARILQAAPGASKAPSHLDLAWSLPFDPSGSYWILACYPRDRILQVVFLPPVHPPRSFTGPWLSDIALGIDCDRLEHDAGHVDRIG